MSSKPLAVRLLQQSVDLRTQLRECARLDGVPIASSVESPLLRALKVDGEEVLEDFSRTLLRGLKGSAPAGDVAVLRLASLLHLMQECDGFANFDSVLEDAAEEREWDTELVLSDDIVPYMKSKTPWLEGCMQEVQRQMEEVE